MPWTLGIIGVVSATTAITSWNVLTPENPGYATWPLGAMTFLRSFVLALRGRRALAWVGFAAVAVISVVLAIVAGQEAIRVINDVLRQSATLVIGTLFAIVLRALPRRLRRCRAARRPALRWRPPRLQPTGSARRRMRVLSRTPGRRWNASSRPRRSASRTSTASVRSRPPCAVEFSPRAPAKQHRGCGAPGSSTRPHRHPHRRPRHGASRRRRRSSRGGDAAAAQRNDVRLRERAARAGWRRRDSDLRYRGGRMYRRMVLTMDSVGS